MQRSTALIVSLSARALAQSAARAGYAVHTADLFADVDTARVALSCTIIEADRQGITPASLARALGQLRHLAPDVIVFGSGFEARPGHIDTLAHAFPRARMAGCSASAVAAAKQPDEFAARLHAHAIDFAPVQLDGTLTQPGWLIKTIGASGGAHVRAAAVGERIAAGEFAQRRIVGEPASALMLSSGRESMLLGLCRHWRGPDVDPDSFEHSGLVTLPPQPEPETPIFDIGRRCAAAFDLRGLWGLDFIIDEGGRPVVVELNPRPTASIELLEGAVSLFAAHVEPGAWISEEWYRPAARRASLVVRAVVPVAVSTGIDWPEWISDRPAAGSMIAPGAPVCTVMASADTPDGAVSLALDRYRRVSDLLAGADGIEKSY